jgi:ribosomal protein S6--L-glutamate ligase
MILSFHPIFVGDKNILMADRQPGPKERMAIQAADAVILPQGCQCTLHQMARSYCGRVFPNYDVRFAYPGKIGQIELFNQTASPCPQTLVFESVADFHASDPVLAFPCVFKLNWGGEGETVFKVISQDQLHALLQEAANYEKSGLAGFLIQTYIPARQRVLRVVAIGDTFYAYWRVQPDAHRFHTATTKGAVIDTASDPELQTSGIAAARQFCRKTGLNLAGIDLLFPSDVPHAHPYFLEINYFFGRRGLGGTDRYYDLLVAAIHKWLHQQGLAVAGGP